MIDEIWAPVENNNRYFISNLGNVKSFKRLKDGVVLKPGLNRGGYLHVVIRKTTPIHRLVAQAFIPNPEGKTDVNHKDNNRLNNNVSNLEWCSRKENILWASKQGRLLGNRSRGEETNNSKLKTQDIIEIRKMHGVKTSKELASVYNVHISNIRYIINRKTWSHV